MRGKAKGINRDAVIEAAVRLAGEEGLEGLSMRKLANLLGIQAMSLYNHVKNREDLLDALVESVVSEYRVPEAGTDWKTAMRDRARSMHDVLLRHNWIVPLLLKRRNSGPNMFRFVNGTLGVLVTAGFSYPLADYAWNALDNHIYGYTMQEVNFPIEKDQYAEVAMEYQEQIDTGDYPYLAEMSGMIIRGEYSGFHDFDFGLELILDGLERKLGAGKED